MMIGAPPILTTLMPGDGAAAAPANVALDATVAFAAMMAGLGQPALSRPGDAVEAAKDDQSDHLASLKDGDGKDDDKKDGTDDHGEDADALLALAGTTASAPSALPVVATSMDGTRSALSSAAESPAAPATSGRAGRSGVDDRAYAGPPSQITAAALKTDVQPAPPPPVKAIDMPQQQVAALAGTVVVGQMVTAAAKSAGAAQRVVIASASVVSTTDILAARIGVRTASDRVKSDKPAAARSENIVADETTLSGDMPSPIAVVQPTAPAAIVGTDGPLAAGQALSASGADRQLDLAKDSAWLDGLARDIASTADTGGTLRFQLNPQRLGKLDVEVTRGDEGTAVRMVTGSEAAHAILADAKPQLIVEARAHGVHISDARIELGSATGASGTSADTGGQGRSTADLRQDNDNRLRDGGTSSGAGGGNDAGRHPQSQSQSQASPQNFYRTVRSVASSAGDSSTGSPLATDERYA